MTVNDLKGYLRRYGQFLTGNKKDLIERTMCDRKLLLLNKLVIENDDGAGKFGLRTEKLRTPLCELTPEPNGLISWTKDVS